MTDSVLAIDAGTSSARAARFDVRGRLIAGSLAQSPGALRTGAGGRATIDAEPWLAAMSAVIAAATAGERVAAVGMSCFWHSFLGVDARGRALTPIYTWADSRCRADAAALRDELDEREIHAETGCMLRASFWPAKLRWLRRTEPALFGRIARFVSPAEWLQWRLTGSATCALGMATGTGLFNPRTRRWSPRMLDVCGLDESRLLPLSDAPSGWGEGARWFPGIGDGAASNLGCGATTPGLAAINLGTSAALRVMRGGRLAATPFGLFCYRVDAHRHLVGGAVSNAGNVFAWALKELRLPADLGAIERALAGRPEPRHGLSVLPFWNAERAPRWNEDDRGVIAGLQQSTSALDLLQAILEGTHYRLAGIAERIIGARGSAPTWIVSGGGARSRSGLRRLATILAAPVYPVAEMEASLRGAAVLALERLGATPAPPKLGAAIPPDAARVAVYREARRRQERLELALGPTAT